MFSRSCLDSAAVRERRRGGRTLLLAALLAATVHGASRPPANLPVVEAIAEALPYVVETKAPVTLLLSKSRYPAEDIHLDAIVWLRASDSAPENGTLRISLRDAAGAALTQKDIHPLPGKRLFLAVPFPSSMAGGDGSLDVEWLDNGREMGRAAQSFAVAPDAGVSRKGRIRLTVPNSRKVCFAGVPMSVGVPFPRGALDDAGNVRLVDEAGNEIPLQTRVTSRWSRFGSLRWLLCDFVLDMDGQPKRIWLEFGPEVVRQDFKGLGFTPPDHGTGTPPTVEAEPIRFGPGGLEYRVSESGTFRPVLAPESLHGAFVEHEDGTRYILPETTPWELEEAGRCKVVLRRRGWYVDPETDRRFCRHDTRYVLQFGSPLVRILHTWIYTGYPYAQRYRWESGRKIEILEGSEPPDRIRDMGWRFATHPALQAEGFLTSFEADGTWRKGDYLLQHDFDRHEIMRADRAVAGARAPGVAAAVSGGVRMLLGVRDFWQNFPNELEFADGGLIAHQWPRHGRPAGTHPPDVRQGLRLWFAHEGESLDFAIPEAYTDDPAFQKANPRNYHLQGFRQTMNAQGIAKTEELWLLLTESAVSADAAARVLAGLNDRTLQAVVDPRWMAASGAFYEMHPYDPETYPDEEQTYALHALAPETWIEQLRFYGKWIWGDMWWAARLRERDWDTSWGLYRGFRKSHQGWPYSWIPYARSGEPRYLRLADAATRHMADVVFCHYSDERVPAWNSAPSTDGPGRPRWRGFSIRFHIPWASPAYDPGSRDYTDKNNYLWHSYYLTGYPRARDVAMDWAHLCKTEGAARWFSGGDVRTVFTGELEAFEAARQSVTLLQSFVEQYQATFDPWFLAAAHQAARRQLEWFHSDGWKGHFWNPGPREFHRFTGSDAYAAFYLAYARHQAEAPRRSAHANWSWLCTSIEPAAYAYELTGDPFFLRQAAFWLDYVRYATYDGDPAYYRGTLVKNDGYNSGPMLTGYFLQHFPFALAAFERAGGRPSASPGYFRYCPSALAVNGRKDRFAYRYCIAIKKTLPHPIPLRLSIQQTLWTPDPDFTEIFDYLVRDEAGAVVLQGSWNVAKEMTPEIPAGAPLGVYRLEISGESRFRPEGSWRQIPSLALPVSPAGTPEVLVLEPGAPIGRSHPTCQFWFIVPEPARTFWLNFGVEGGGGKDRRRMDLHRFSVWDPEGRRHWDEQFSALDRPGVRSIRADITVPDALAGRLWRMTVAGLNPGIEVDPAIPRILATSSDRWFQPGPETPAPGKTMKANVHDGVTHR